MSDQLATTTRGLLSALDSLQPYRLTPAEARHIGRLAAWLAVQRSNPLFNHTLSHLLLWDLADATLAWVEHPDREHALAVLTARDLWEAGDLGEGPF